MTATTGCVGWARGVHLWKGTGVLTVVASVVIVGLVLSAVAEVLADELDPDAALRWASSN